MCVSKQLGKPWVVAQGQDRESQSGDGGGASCEDLE